jgi:hypothetical protein
MEKNGSTASFGLKYLLVQRVLDHFTEKSFHRKMLTKRSFDQNTILPNAICPKIYSTESPFNRTPFDRMPFDRKFILPKGRMTDFYFPHMKYGKY